MEVFGVFEGGGVKGTALVGALKAAEEASLDFVSLGGSSAGAIVAALAAARYSADEMYQEMMNKNYTDFLDDIPDEFGRVRQRLGINDLRRLYSELQNDIGFLDGLDPWKAIRLFLKYRGNRYIREIRLRLRQYQGIYAGTEFTEWFRKLLTSKLDIDDPTMAELFSKTGRELHIVSTRLRSAQAEVYDSSSSEYVARVVRASISIPFVFRPAGENDDPLVDGGLISNFPAWAFDGDRIKFGPRPMLAFRLDADQSLGPPITVLPSFSKAVVRTALEGKNLLQTRLIPNLHPIRIPTGDVDALSFDISNDKKEELFRIGYDTATNYLRTSRFAAWGNLKAVFNQSVEQVRKAFAENNHLRMNLFEEADERLRYITMWENMDEDDDRWLTLNDSEGATAICWNSGRPVLTDLRDPVRYYRNTESGDYDSGFITEENYLSTDNADRARKSLKSIFSFPVMNLRGRVVAVFNIDSDDDFPSHRLLNGNELNTQRAEEIVDTLRIAAGYLGAVFENQ